MKCEYKTLNYMVTIEKPSGTSDGYGQVDLRSDANWSTYTTRRASVEHVSSSEGYAEEQLIGTRVVRVGFNGDAVTRQILPSYRVKYTDRDNVTHRMQVRGVIEKSHGTWVELSCVEEVA